MYTLQNKTINYLSLLFQDIFYQKLVTEWILRTVMKFQYYFIKTLKSTLLVQECKKKPN